MWDIESGELLYKLSGHSKPVLSVAISSNTVLSSGNDSKIIQWNLHNGLMEYSFRSDNVNTVGVSFDPSIFAAGKFDLEVREAQDVTCMFKNCSLGVTVIAFSLTGDIWLGIAMTLLC